MLCPECGKTYPDPEKPCPACGYEPTRKDLSDISTAVPLLTSAVLLTGALVWVLILAFTGGNALGALGMLEITFREEGLVPVATVVRLLPVIVCTAGLWLLIGCKARRKLHRISLTVIQAGQALNILAQLSLLVLLAMAFTYPHRWFAVDDRLADWELFFSPALLLLVGLGLGIVSGVLLIGSLQSMKTTSKTVPLLPVVLYYATGLAQILWCVCNGRYPGVMMGICRILAAQTLLECRFALPGVRPDQKSRRKWLTRVAALAGSAVLVFWLLWANLGSWMGPGCVYLGLSTTISHHTQGYVLRDTTGELCDHAPVQVNVYGMLDGRGDRNCQAYFQGIVDVEGYSIPANRVDTPKYGTRYGFPVTDRKGCLQMHYDGNGLFVDGSIDRYPYSYRVILIPGEPESLIVQIPEKHIAVVCAPDPQAAQALYTRYLGAPEIT